MVASDFAFKLGKILQKLQKCWKYLVKSTVKNTN